LVSLYIHTLQITFSEKPVTVEGLYKFIKKHAVIPFEPIRKLEEMISDDEDEIKEERNLEKKPISTLEEVRSENREQTEHEIEEV
jgi:hypothetical protein